MEPRYDHQKFEKTAQDLWEKESAYKFKTDSSKQLYSIDTPPPTVSGALHIGHIFSYTHTDVIARYKRLAGFNVFYPMGFDDNGLPTERFVEKKHNTKANLMKRSEFIRLCLEESRNVERLFENLWRGIGLSVDWDLTYSTISSKARRISQLSFLELYKKDLVFRKEEPSLYCTTCQTSIAQADLDSIELASTFNDIEFSAENGEKIIIATTRPELLPACVAVFFNPRDSRYKHLENLFAITPIFGKKVPLLADDKVDMEKGTGLVMCCTFGDQTDIYWQKKHKLPFIQAVGFDGKWTAATGELIGLRIHDARKKIIDLLKESGVLLNQKQITHSVSVHERCKQEIEFLILTQWFVKILDHKEKLLELGEQLNWKPEFMKARYRDWVQNLNWDWCISRQRFFGIPFPVWHCLDCNQVILADEKDLPIDPQETQYSGEKCPTCSSKNLRPDTDVMDTWNTSSLTPQINIDWGETPKAGFPTLPMSMRPQAHDIIRTWAFYTVIKSYYHSNCLPWNDIVISGHVLAGSEKISKSKENSKMAPESLLQTYPADAIRYWSANGKLGTDTAFSENQLKIGMRLITKIWNAFRFISEHLTNYTKPATTPELNNINKWLLHEFSQVMKKYTEEFDQYNYHQALDIVEKFFWNNFCDNYLEIIKDQLFNPSKYSKEIIEGTKFTLYRVGFGLLQLFSPVLPHICENIYQMLFRNNSDIQLLTLSILQKAEFDFASSVHIVEHILKLIAAVRKLKSENNISLKTELENLEIHTQDLKLIDELKHEILIISGVIHAKNISFNKKQLIESTLSFEEEKWTATVGL